jgi:hypothetical protein
MVAIRHHFRPLRLVYAEVVNVPFRVLLAGVLAMPALAQTEQELQKLLPPDARIIEVANLTVSTRKPRALVLWMRNPNRVVRHEGIYCGDYVYGDYWKGPARLSLVDPAEPKLINTVEIHSDFEKEFAIPFLVPNGYYHVPHPNAKQEGTPRILYLRDLTGERVIGQFALFQYPFSCGNVDTSVFGYSPATDEAMQYQVETLEGKHRPDLSTWVPRIFATEPIHPGYWRFTWEAGHGDWFWNHEEVSFDQKRQLFVRRLNRQPYPGFGEASCDLETKKLSRLLESFKPLFESSFSDSQIQDLEQWLKTRPPGKDQLATPLDTAYKGKATSVTILVKKYTESEIGIWIVADREVAAELQKKIDEVTRQ